MVKRRNRTHANFKKTGNVRLKKKWHILRKQVKLEVNSAHENYVNNLIGEIKKRFQTFLEVYKRQKSDKQGIPPLKSNNGSIAESDLSKAEALNEQFTSVFTHTEYFSVPFEKPSVNKMDNITISSKGVENILHGLNTTKAMGPDNLHPKVLKELAPSLAYN